MKTQMTKDVGFDEFYESGGAVEPEEAAKSLLEFAATITKEHNGQFWAPRGPGESPSSIQQFSLASSWLDD
jgi:hypothetical protein